MVYCIEQEGETCHGARTRYNSSKLKSKAMVELSWNKGRIKLILMYIDGLQTEATLETATPRRTHLHGAR